MSNQVMSAFEGAFISNLESIRYCINNCPDDLWETKFGGDYYWQQAYHVTVGIMGMLKDDTPLPILPIPEDVAALQGENLYSGPHDKKIVLDVLEKVPDHLESYFSKKTDDNLFDEVDFYGHKMPLISILQIGISHIMYHVGIFDAALRERGIKGAIG